MILFMPKTHAEKLAFLLGVIGLFAWHSWNANGIVEMAMPTYPHTLEINWLLILNLCWSEITIWKWPSPGLKQASHGWSEFHKHWALPLEPFPAEPPGDACYLQLRADIRTPLGEEGCLTIFITPSPGQPHTIFRGFTTVSGGWMLLCEECIRDCKDRAHTTMQCVITF